MRLSFREQQNPRSVSMMKARLAEVIKLQLPLQYAEPTPADMQLEDDDIAWVTCSGMWRTRIEMPL